MSTSIQWVTGRTFLILSLFYCLLFGNTVYDGGLQIYMNL